MARCPRMRRGGDWSRGQVHRMVVIGPSWAPSWRPCWRSAGPAPECVVALPSCPSTRSRRNFLPTSERSRHLALVEEHVAHGGAGELIARELLLRGRARRASLTPAPWAMSPAGTGRRRSIVANAGSMPKPRAPAHRCGAVVVRTRMSGEPTPGEAGREDRRLQGPILVLGGSGFIGANLFRALLSVRDDVFGTASRLPAWRLEGLPDGGTFAVADLLVDSNLDQLLDEVRPQTIFNCIAYGAYSFETESQLIYQTNFNFTSRLLARLATRPISFYGHAGTSSEYGDNACRARGDRTVRPQQRLRGLEGRGREPDLLLRPEEGSALREPSALLGLRAAGGRLPLDPEPRPLRPRGAPARSLCTPTCRATSCTLTTWSRRSSMRPSTSPRRVTATRSTSGPGRRPPSATSPELLARCSGSRPSRSSPCRADTGT